MLSKERRDVDAHQHHEKNGCSEEDRQLLANDAKKSSLKMCGVSQVQIPSVVFAIVLLARESCGQACAPRPPQLNPGLRDEDERLPADHNEEADRAANRQRGRGA